VTITGTGSPPDEIRVIPSEARSVQGRRAGIASRLLAVAIDVVVVVILLLVAYGAWSGLLFVLRGRSFTFPTVGLAPAISAGAFLFVVYCAIGWAADGKTYGGQVLGLRVVDRTGRRMRPARALLRAVLSAVFPLGLVWCAIGAESRSVQDLVLGTSVIYDWEVHPRSRSNDDPGGPS
jgi:uncharacterized RDD family membrane protein YckC